MPVLTAEEHLMELMQNWAVVRAEPGQKIRLASGTETEYFFDGKRVIQTPEATPVIGELVWRYAQELGADAVGGLATGCIPIADAAVAYDAFVGKRGLRAFYVRDDKKDHGTEENLYQAHLPGTTEPLVGPGRRVLIVDDILTTGNSIMKSVDEVTRRGAEVVGVLVLVDRQDPRSVQTLKSRVRGFKALFVSNSDGILSLA